MTAVRATDQVQAAEAVPRARARLMLAVVAVSLAALAVLVSYAALRWTTPGLELLQKLARLSEILVWCGVAALAILIVWKGRPTRGNVALALAMSLISLNNGVYLLAEAWRPGDETFLMLVEVQGAFAAAAYLRAGQLFPNPLTATEFDSPRSPWSGRMRWLRIFLRAQLDPRIVWIVWPAVLILAVAAAPPALDLSMGPLVVLLGAAYWYVHFRVGDDLERRQIVWFLQTALAFVVVAVLAAAANALLAAHELKPVRPLVAIVFNVGAAAVILTFLFLAIFRAGAVNPDLIVRRTLVYAGAAALLLGVLNVIQSVLVDTAVDAFGIDDRLVAAVLGTAAGLAFEPLTRRLKRFFDGHAQSPAEGGDHPAGLAAGPPSAP